MMKTAIRPAVSDDIGAVYDIELCSFSVPWSISDFHELLGECGSANGGETLGTYFAVAEACADEADAGVHEHGTKAVTAEEAAKGERADSGTQNKSGNIVGYICARRVLDEGEIMNIAVKPGIRRSGIGRRLLESAIEALSSGGADRVYLEVRESNTPAKTLYEAAGFVPVAVRRRYYRCPTEDAIVMMRII